MDKNKLVQFLSLYNLSGTVESVKIISDGTTLKTTFVAEDKTLAGSVSFLDAQLEKCELGVFNTTLFKNFLKVLDNAITITLNKTDDKLTGLSLADANTEVNFVLSDLSVIPSAPKVKEVKSFDVEIPVDTAFADRFIKAKNALPDVDIFTIVPNKKTDKLELVIGFSSINSNRIKVDIKPTVGKDKLDNPISFNANHFKEILTQNKDSGATSIVLKIAANGIATISYVGKEFESNYFMIMKKIED